MPDSRCCHGWSSLARKQWDARIAAKRARIASLPCPLRLVYGLSLCSLSPAPASGIPSHLAQSKSIYP